MKFLLVFRPWAVLAGFLVIWSVGRAENLEAPNPVEASIRQGDAFDQKLQAKEALQCYLPAEKAEPKNVHVLLGIARQYRHLMADAPKADEKMRLANLGRVYAARAVAVAPNEAETHLSMAICYAKMVPLLGNKEKMEASRRVKESVDKAIALDPNLDLAWHVLGSWHQRLSELSTVKRTMARVVYGKLPAASNEDSVRCFEKAIALNPNRLIHHVELGRTYAQMGRTADARRFLTKGLSMPNVGKDDADAKVKARAALAALK